MIPFKQLIELMAQKNISQHCDLVGVSDTEIKAMQSHFNVEFPASYSEFLRLWDARQAT